MYLDLDSTKSQRPTQRRLNRVRAEVKQLVLNGENGQRWIGHVTDESQGGIGLEFSTLPPVRAGQELELVLNDVRMLAQVRHVSQTAQGGCRVGIEWNAHCLAERARHKRNSASEKAACLGERTRRFIDLAPGAIYLIWRNFENRKWQDCLQSAYRIQLVASDCGIQQLDSCVNELERVIGGQKSETVIRKVVEELIRQCVMAAEQIAATAV